MLSVSFYQPSTKIWGKVLSSLPCPTLNEPAFPQALLPKVEIVFVEAVASPCRLIMHSLKGLYNMKSVLGPEFLGPNPIMFHSVQVCG